MTMRTELLNNIIINVDGIEDISFNYGSLGLSEQKNYS